MTKIAIVVFVFPIVAYAAGAGFALVFGPVLHFVPESWQQSALIVAIVLAFLVGFTCAFLASRWAWPKKAKPEADSIPS